MVWGFPSPAEPSFGVRVLCRDSEVWCRISALELSTSLYFSSVIAERPALMHQSRTSFAPDCGSLHLKRKCCWGFGSTYDIAEDHGPTRATCASAGQPPMTAWKVEQGRPHQRSGPSMATPRPGMQASRQQMISPAGRCMWISRPRRGTRSRRTAVLPLRTQGKC